MCAENIVDILSQRIQTHIERKYYHDISRSDVWDDLVERSVRQKLNLAEEIECLAENSTVNLRRFTLNEINSFEFIYKTFISKESSENLRLMKFYCALLCYFYNGYSEAKKAPILNLEKNDRIDFFYHKALEDELSIICDDKKSEIDFISKRLGLRNAKQSDLIQMLKELLVLPFLNVGKIFSIKTSDITEIKSAVLEEVSSLLRNTNKSVNNSFENFYREQGKTAFAWLKNDDGGNAFIDDIFAVLAIFEFLKKLHFLCGSKKIYGYYQRLIDKQSGNVLYSIPYKGRMFLLNGTSAVEAGKSNIDNVEVLPKGELLINFKHGQFFDSAITQQAAFNMALAFNDTVLDYLTIFQSVSKRQNGKEKTIGILLEMPRENTHFSEIVYEQIEHFKPAVISHIRIAPSLKHASKIEKDRYLRAFEIVLTEEQRRIIVENIKKVGQKAAFQVPETAFRDVRVIQLKAGDVLIQEGDPSEFVYFPFDNGLKGYSKISRMEFFPKPWAPIGHIGAIQNDLRTASISVEKPLQLLMIPGNVYLRYWHVDYTVEELYERIKMISAIPAE